MTPSVCYTYLLEGLYTELFWAIIPILFPYFCHSGIPTSSLAGQLYFSGRQSGRKSEKYVWTLWTAFHARHRNVVLL